MTHGYLLLLLLLLLAVLWLDLRKQHTGNFVVNVTSQSAYSLRVSGESAASKRIDFIAGFAFDKEDLEKSYQQPLKGKVRSIVSIFWQFYFHRTDIPMYMIVNVTGLKTGSLQRAELVASNGTIISKYAVQKSTSSDGLYYVEKTVWASQYFYVRVSWFARCFEMFEMSIICSDLADYWLRQRRIRVPAYQLHPIGSGGV